MPAKQTVAAQAPTDPFQQIVILSQLLVEARERLARDQAAAHRQFDHAATLLHTDVEDVVGGLFCRGGLAPWQVKRLREHICANISGRLSTAELAALAGLSASYFSSAFRVSFGCSPHAYVTRQRVLAAQDLIAKEALPLAEVALQCGFSDQPHLCRQFRRATGVTPASWRRRLGPDQGSRRPVLRP